jgi:hypothetical protein
VHRAPGDLPLWARAADALVGMLFLFALFVAMSGGVVFRLGVLRVSATSPARVLAWAGALLVLRHLFVRRQPFPLFILGAIRAASPVAGTLPEDSGLIGARAEPEPWKRSVRAFALATIVYLLLTAAMTYPQARFLTDTVVPDYGDPLFSTWRISWIAHQLPRDPLHLFDANIFYPERHALAFSDAMIVPSLMVAPLLWSGVHQVVAYNVLLLSAFGLSALTMFALVRSLTRHTGAALIAGAVFGFLPYRFLHYGHVELQMAQWMPLCLWALHRTIAGARLRDGLLTGVFLTLQTLSSFYYGIFFATYLALVGSVLLIGAGRQRALRALRPLMAGAALAALLTAPFTIPYFRARQAVGERGLEEIQIYSAEPHNYLAAPYPNVMFGVSSWRQNLGGPERELFQGIAGPLLVVVAMWPPISAVRIVYALGFAFAFDASLGYNGYVYPLLHEFAFPYRGLRVPARMAILVGLSLAILAGFGAARIAAISPRRWLTAAALGTLAMGILLEYRSTVRLRYLWRDPPPVYDALPPSARVIFEMPLVDPDMTLEPLYMYFSTFHWRQLVNGYSGFSPRSHRQFVAMMETFPDDAAMMELRRRDVDAIVVHGAFFRSPDAYKTLVDALDERPDVVLVRTVKWHGHESRVYRMGEAPAGGSVRVRRRQRD